MICRNTHRHFCRMYSHKKVPSSSEIRKTFLDYFVEENGHKFVRSSPVVPFCDPTVAFVNAGMNQFKSIFLGTTEPTSKRVANSQKCIRVGGKHNDLSVVGKDGYHHTFFEMLGNWSFGDYFKKEACEMAWNLLNGPFGIGPSRLYVTYFQGDETLNLPADHECRDIWRNLGVPDDRILPFGSNDNFWEMGATGPCGPCTEIHIDHLPNSDPRKRSKFVNAGHSNLTELWNLVFIEYNRNNDGTINSLPEKHIDTGMGMERLTAILQEKSTNYETDLFLPIFNTIHKATKLPPYSHEFDPTNDKYTLDVAYRLLADHSRMITACLADGMLPDQNHKLRRIIRKSMLVSSNTFQQNCLLHAVIPKVVDILSPTYPEMHANLPDVLEILSHEYEVFMALRQNNGAEIEKIVSENHDLEEIDFFDSPGFIGAYKDLQKSKVNFINKTIPGEFAFKLRDTYGLNEETAEKLAIVEGLHLDRNGYLQELAKARERSKHAFNLVGMANEVSQTVSRFTVNLKNTDDFYKYNYTYNASSNMYDMPVVRTKILGLLENGNIVDSVRADGAHISIITEKSNFYYESGGQQDDRGCIVKSINDSNVQFNVEAVGLSNGCVMHSGSFTESNNDSVLRVKDEVDLHVDPIRRTKNILNHTATHLLNASARSILKGVVYQLSSSVTSDYLKLELGILGRKVNREILQSIELLIRQVISHNVRSSVEKLSIQDVLNTKDIIMVPGEIYPETGLRLMSLEDSITGLRSKELCCGTHAFSTYELQDFCFTNFQQTGRSKYMFTAVAGNTAVEMRQRDEKLVSAVSQVERCFENNPHEIDALYCHLTKIRSEIMNSGHALSYLTQVECLHRVDSLMKNMKDASKITLKEFVEIEMRNVLQENPFDRVPFIVHFLKCSTMMEDISLHKATRLCPDRPILVISLTKGMVKARCCVPKDKAIKFPAEDWLAKFASIFNAQISPPKGQNPKEVCNMKARKTHSALFHEQLEVAINEARKFAKSQL